METPLRDIARQLIKFLELMGKDTKAYFVGGCVRDGVMGIPCSDYDIEVFGLPIEDLHRQLNHYASTSHDMIGIHAVGKSFGILKVRTVHGDIDFSVPRKENRVGVGHADFQCHLDPSMTIKEAASRRDFTMNTLSETIHGEIIDPFGGVCDIRTGTLRHASLKFGEDPLRVLRAMQFCSRFGFMLAEETATVCQEIHAGIYNLSVERIWMEWKKWALGHSPAAGIQALIDTNWITHYPELLALVHTEQDPEWHPEGNVLAHTMHAVNAAATIGRHKHLGEEDMLVLVFATLCHDMGKPCTTIKNEKGRIVAPMHPEAGVSLAEDFLSSIGAPSWLVERVLPLVREHMTHIHVKMPTKRLVARLAQRLVPTNIAMLRLVCMADYGGRPPLSGKDPMQDWEKLAAYYDVDTQKPARILMGRHLIRAGLTPGPAMGKILDEAFEAQLDGEINTLEEALVWVETRLH